MIKRPLLIAFLACLVPAMAAAQATRPTTRPADLVENVTDAAGLDQALEKLRAPMRETDPLPAAEALKRFKPRPGLAVDLIASEPAVRQPLCINFDERGRMWVVQYVQYPFPAGLKVVEYDRYIRAKFDKVPAAPPHHAAGKDVVSILEDTDGDGSFRTVKTFVSGLSIATSALPGRGGRGAGDYGVWVMNPPYLLFYPDKDRNDVPDADPIVHLSGFGLEDTHAVASNLTWGPDGWLYGTQGSTCTAKVKVEVPDPKSGVRDPKTTDFLGQAVWRYHPERHVFELFAEGGGNTFGLEFDDAGNAFSGTNWGKYRGLHYVQGGYYVKGWGKHGPLTNPYAFGWFEHMPHEGNADRLSHTFVVYGGTLLGPEYRGKIISPNSLQSRIQVTRLEPQGSTFKTVEEPFMITTDDGWFRPVDLKVGPDGAIYVADFYERRISHVDPRDTWERGNGRIWRIRPFGWKPGIKQTNLASEPLITLPRLLPGENRWERATVRRVFRERSTDPAIPVLRSEFRKLLESQHGRAALEVLWSLHATGGLDDRTTLDATKHDNGAVRAWAIRLAADVRGSSVPSPVFDRLIHIAQVDDDPLVRSQLASSARRLAGEQAVPLVAEMLRRDGDAGDPHVPLLLWWALEDKADSHRELVTAAMSDPSLWRHKMARETVLPRLARRYAAEPTPANQEALVKLLDAAPGDVERGVLLEGVKQALAGTTAPALSPALLERFTRAGDIELALRAGDASVEPAVLAVVTDEKADKTRRVRLIEALGQTGKTAGTALLKVAEGTPQREIRAAAIAALPRFESAELADGLVSLYPKIAKDADAKAAALASLMSRPAWAAALLRAIAGGTIPRGDLSPADVERLRQFDDPAVVALVEKIFGKAVRATDAEKLREVAQVNRLVTTGAGDAARGKVLYTARCAACHTLFGEGGKAGPDLTGYDRRNVGDMVTNVVDPSAYIREEFASFQVKTKGGEVYVGLIAERAGDRLTIVDAAQQRTTVARADVAAEKALATSLMPEGLLAGFSDQEVRDLFKYLAAPAPAK